MRTLVLCLALLALLVPAGPARAGDDPTPAELATMILDGNDAEHALVARWLETADRAELRAVFAELRARRRARAMEGEPPRAGTRRVISAELRVIDLPADAAGDFFGRLPPTSDKPAVHLPAEDAAGVLDALEKRADVNLVSAPRITVYDGQKANVSMLNEVSYVQDFDVEVTKDGPIADPIVQTIQEGTLIDFTPSLDAERKSIRLEYAGTFATIQRPIPSAEVELPGTGGRKVTIQLPELKVARMKTTVDVPDGGWVLIGGGVILEPTKGERIERVTLVHLTSLPLEEGAIEHAGPEIKLR